jgi:hypothetical protein
MSLTYAPKIAVVQTGDIRQTVRIRRSLVVKRTGDWLLIHTWSGKPYRTPWGWRMKVMLTDVLHLRYFGNTWRLVIENDEQVLGERWVNDEQMAELAAKDGIVPATRYGLESTLKTLNGLAKLENTEWQVFRW